MKDRFKVQRPLSSTVDDAPCLVYNRTRTIHLEVPTAVMREHFERLGNPLKFYCEGHIADDGKFVVDTYLSALPW